VAISLLMPAVYSSVTPHCNHFVAFTLNYLQVPNSYKGVNILLKVQV